MTHETANELPEVKEALNLIEWLSSSSEQEVRDSQDMIKQTIEKLTALKENDAYDSDNIENMIKVLGSYLDGAPEDIFE